MDYALIIAMQILESAVVPGQARIDAGTEERMDTSSQQPSEEDTR